MAMQFTPEQEKELEEMAEASDSKLAKAAPECQKDEDELEPYASEEDENTVEISAKVETKTEDRENPAPNQEAKKPVHEVNVVGPKVTQPKTFLVKGDNKYGMFVISFKEGGQIPAELAGNYTSVKAASDAITGYMKKQEQKAA